jgi:hypothetical protein
VNNLKITKALGCFSKSPDQALGLTAVRPDKNPLTGPNQTDRLVNGLFLLDIVICPIAG